MILHKIQRWPQRTKTITTNRNDKNWQGRSPTVATTVIIKNNKDRQERQQPTVFHTVRIPLSSPHGKPPATNAGRLIQPNNLLKVLTPDVQSLSPKIDELIALIQEENFDVTALNETRLATQNKHLLAEVAIHGKVFHVNKLSPIRWAGGSKTP